MKRDWLGSSGTYYYLFLTWIPAWNSTDHKRTRLVQEESDSITKFFTVADMPPFLRGQGNHRIILKLLNLMIANSEAVLPLFFWGWKDFWENQPPVFIKERLLIEREIELESERSYIGDHAVEGPRNQPTAEHEPLAKRLARKQGRSSVELE